MIYEVSKKKKGKERKSWRGSPSQTCNTICFYRRRQRHGHLTKSLSLRKGIFWEQANPGIWNPGLETKRNVGDNKPNHYGYDNAAKDPDPRRAKPSQAEPNRTPLERLLSSGPVSFAKVLS